MNHQTKQPDSARPTNEKYIDGTGNHDFDVEEITVNVEIEYQTLDQLKEAFEANLLDGDSIQERGQMINASDVWEWIENYLPSLIQYEKKVAVEQSISVRPEPNFTGYTNRIIK